MQKIKEIAESFNDFQKIVTSDFMSHTFIACRMEAIKQNAFVIY